MIAVEGRGEGWIIYRDTGSGERWRIAGVCCCCGLCEVGAVNPHLVWLGPPGTPGACVDARGADRPDVPVRPELPGKMGPACTLTGEYL